MEYTTLDLTLVSATGLTKAGKLSVYAVTSISDSRTVISKVQKFKTPFHKDGGSDPTWNFPMKFTLNKAASHMTLVVKIKGARMLVDKNLGEVRVPIKELLEGVDPEGKTRQNVSYHMIGRGGEVKGVVSFSYKFGGKSSPSGKGVGSSSAYDQPWAAGGHSSSSNGFGTGFVGGLLISDVANNAGCGRGVRRVNSFPTFSKRVFRSRVLAPLGTRGDSLVIEFITHKHQSSFAMSLTIFPSLTTIFSGGGHHSPPHPTISPQPTNTLTKINHNA
ncbi:putative C2 domain-containing protein [Helianthus anomalus]